MPTVLIADDHEPIRAGVAATLEEAGFTVCADVEDAAGAVEAAARERPDICLLDIHMPGNGILAAAEILSSLPGTAVVMLTVSDRDDDLFAALHAGASGYLLKDMDPGRLPAALHAVLEGEGAMPPPLVGRMIDEFRARGRRKLRGSRHHVELTEREWDVLDLLRQGQTTGEIAYRLGISDVTVRRHISQMLKKAGVRDRNELLRVLDEQQPR